MVYVMAWYSLAAITCSEESRYVATDDVVLLGHNELQISVPQRDVLYNGDNGEFYNWIIYLS